MLAHFTLLFLHFNFTIVSIVLQRLSLYGHSEAKRFHIFSIFVKSCMRVSVVFFITFIPILTTMLKLHVFYTMHDCVIVFQIWVEFVVYVCAFIARPHTYINLAKSLRNVYIICRFFLNCLCHVVECFCRFFLLSTYSATRKRHKRSKRISHFAL